MKLEVIITKGSISIVGPCRNLFHREWKTKHVVETITVNFLDSLNEDKKDKAKLEGKVPRIGNVLCYPHIVSSVSDILNLLHESCPMVVKMTLTCESKLVSFVKESH